MAKDLFLHAKKKKLTMEFVNFIMHRRNDCAIALRLNILLMVKSSEIEKKKKKKRDKNLENKRITPRVILVKIANFAEFSDFLCQILEIFAEPSVF